MAGRPRKDTITTQELIINLAKSGMTITDIAKYTGLARMTIQRWLTNTELGNTIKTVRQANAMLEEEQKITLNKSAQKAVRQLIKKHKLKEIEERRDGDGNLLYTQTKIKEVDPNAGIVQLVLKQTDPKNWSEQYIDKQLDNETESDNKLTFELVDESKE